MDAERLHALFESHHLALYRALRRLTGDAEAAEELVQETFARALGAAEGYEERGLERAWLFTIARRLLVDRRRAEGRRPTHAALGPGGEPEAARAGASSSGAASGLPLALASKASRAGATRDPLLRLALDEALAALDESEREAFVLREVGGLGHEEIARVIGATKAAVRNRIHRARLALREALSPALTSVRKGRTAGDRR